MCISSWKVWFLTFLGLYDLPKQITSAFYGLFESYSEELMPMSAEYINYPAI